MMSSSLFSRHLPHAPSPNWPRKPLSYCCSCQPETGSSQGSLKYLPQVLSPGTFHNSQALSSFFPSPSCVKLFPQAAQFTFQNCFSFPTQHTFEEANFPSTAFPAFYLNADSISAVVFHFFIYHPSLTLLPHRKSIQFTTSLAIMPSTNSVPIEFLIRLKVKDGALWYVGPDGQELLLQPAPSKDEESSDEESIVNKPTTGADVPAVDAPTAAPTAAAGDASGAADAADAAGAAAQAVPVPENILTLRGIPRPRNVSISYPNTLNERQLANLDGRSQRAWTCPVCHGRVAGGPSWFRHVAAELTACGFPGCGAEDLGDSSAVAKHVKAVHCTRELTCPVS
ncbi:hypothetical protein F4774DRAFT_308252 [Daldinia eschscholtzii]|nr:hypothetical protein F4774DRAFT_308252 [Daldinia eschscholtzii]